MARGRWRDCVMIRWIRPSPEEGSAAALAARSNPDRSSPLATPAATGRACSWARGGHTPGGYSSMVERQPSKLHTGVRFPYPLHLRPAALAAPSPNRTAPTSAWSLPPEGAPRRESRATRRARGWIPCCCSSVVEHFLGKEEVTGSSPVSSSILFAPARDGPTARRRGASTHTTSGIVRAPSGTASFPFGTLRRRISVLAFDARFAPELSAQPGAVISVLRRRDHGPRGSTTTCGWARGPAKQEFPPTRSRNGQGSFERNKDHVNVGTIGHVDHGKTTTTPPPSAVTRPPRAWPRRWPST